LKYESYHDSPLSRFLLKRALRNKSLGHYFYWTLKSELHQPQVCERFTLMLDGFLKSGGAAREDIALQEMVLSSDVDRSNRQIHQSLVDIAYKIKKEKSSPLTLLQQELRDLNKSWPGRVQLMLDPLFMTKVKMLNEKINNI
jgi:phosphatidylinositol-4,5-bisphosphate 3-kinase